MKVLPRCLKSCLWHSFIIPSHLLMAGSPNAMCDCLGRSHMVPWLCCHISLPSVQNSSVLLLITSLKVVNSVFLNICRFEAFSGLAFELPSC